MSAARLEHRMADPVVRRRVAALVLAFTAVTWGAVAAAGTAAGPFGTAELRDLSGVPVPPPQIDQRIAPPTDPVDDLGGMVDELNRILQSGDRLAPPSGDEPSP